MIDGIIIIDSISADSVRRSEESNQRIIDSLVQEYEKTHSVVSVDHVAGNQEETIGTILSIAVLVLIIGSAVAYYWFNRRYWHKGIFPPLTRNTADNRYEAVLHLAVNIIRLDREEKLQKMNFLQQFLMRQYPVSDSDMSESFASALTEPASTASICAWLKPKLSNKQRNDLFEALFTIAVMDGRMGQREYAELTDFCNNMGIALASLTEKSDAHRRKYAEQAHKEQQQRTERTSNFDYNYLKNKYLSALGLSSGFTESALKKAYRKQAKLCHPDVAKAATPDEMRRLEERFLEIQEAYEYLLKIV